MTRVDRIITPKKSLTLYMDETGLTKFYDPNYLYELSEQYDIDPGFALATFILETGWGEISEPWLNGFNPAGITCGEAYCHYESAKQGMEDMYRLLREYVDGAISYVGKRNTVAEVRAKWSGLSDAEEIVAIWRSIYDKGRN